MRRLWQAAILAGGGLGLLSAAAEDLRPFTPERLAAIVAQRSGQPFVLAFWSLDCARCAQELADFGRRPTERLVLVSTDTLAERDAIRSRLARYGLERAECWVFADDYAPEQLRAAVDPHWYGELPRSYFYAADGSRQAVSGPPPAALLDRWLGPAPRGATPED